MSVSDTPLSAANTVIVRNNRITRLQYGATYFNSLAYVFIPLTSGALENVGRGGDRGDPAD